MKMFKSLLVALMAVLVMGITSPAEAVILSGGLTGGNALTNGGTFIKLVGYNGSVGNNNFQNNNLYGFDEDQNIVIPSQLNSNVGLTPLPVGTTVASHYVFFDPGPARRAIGFVDFDAVILSIMTSTGNMAASDFLINNSVTYLNPGARGLEGGDVVSIDPNNSKRILIDFTASTPGDYIRVLTQRSPIAANAVPEPATMALMGIGLGGIGFIRKRK